MFNSRFANVLACPFLIVILFCAESRADSKWFGSYSATALSSGTRYLPPFGGNTNNGTESSSHQVMPTAGTVKSLYVKVSVDPAGGAGTQSVTFTFRVNAAGSSLTCTVSEGSTTCSDLVNTAAVAAGDRVALQKTDANTPTLGTVSWILEFEPTVATETVLMGVTNATNLTTGTRYLSFVGGVLDNATEADHQIIAPSGGTLSKLYVHFTANTGADTTFTLRVNTANCSSSIAVTVLSGAQTGNETATTCTISAGDLIALQSSTVGTPGTGVTFGIVYSPTTTGDFAIPSSTGANNAGTGAVNYLALSAAVGLNATETNVQTYAQADYTIKAVYVKLTVAPGAAKQWDFALRENAGAPSNTFAVTIAGAAATTGNLTGQSFTPTAGALYDTSTTPTGTPANTRIHVTYLGNIAAASSACTRTLLGVGC